LEAARPGRQALKKNVEYRRRSYKVLVTPVSQPAFFV
jgi:hypothetical protein